MMRYLLILVFALGLAADGDKDGRRGNALYKEGGYEAAADAYYAGLGRYAEGEVDATFYGLQNNLGAALYKQGQFAMARSAFIRAMETAPAALDFARSAYNAGNNAFREQQAEAALAYYQKALLADPTNADAKFNYEFVKRQLEQQQQEQQGDGENEDQQDGENQNQDQQQQDENQENQEQEQQQQQQNQEGEQQDEQAEQQQQQQQQPDESEQLSRQQAERILQALENEEEELLREVQKIQGRPRRVEKDW